MVLTGEKELLTPELPRVRFMLLLLSLNCFLSLKQFVAHGSLWWKSPISEKNISEDTKRLIWLYCSRLRALL